MEQIVSGKGNSEFPKFDSKKMERFIKKDLFAAKLFEGLNGGTKASRLEAVFNGCVLGDSFMIRSYENA